MDQSLFEFFFARIDDHLVVVMELSSGVLVPLCWCPYDPMSVPEYFWMLSVRGTYGL